MGNRSCINTTGSWKLEEPDLRASALTVLEANVIFWHLRNGYSWQQCVLVSRHEGSDEPYHRYWHS